jgi:hypothetical protein
MTFVLAVASAILPSVIGTVPPTIGHRHLPVEAGDTQVVVVIRIDVSDDLIDEETGLAAPGDAPHQLV